ncbi:epoxide hydrolase family protein [Flavisphingomonas formosensis]|uniref:epoxide hydrolase family protein n=1 Tax=Flavisphingomonas formosensis TaxID=861534 RepID=UPI0012FCC679|nr:epoxide hydrolase family protein [Sphingomonas formosensis]
MTPEPFRIAISQDVLDDLARRLAAARFAPDFANEDWSYGVPTRYLRELMTYWREGFDWRAQERTINRHPHFRVEIDGIPIHFMHIKGKGTAPLPLILTHGWPWSFWDFASLVDPLADPVSDGADPLDAFDLVIPSLPGFAFSTPLSRPFAIWETADLWVKLMDALGYERFGAHGGDFGVLVTEQLGHKYPERMLGVHLSPCPRRLDIWNVARPWADLVAGPLSGAAARDGRVIAWEARKVGHAVAQALSPQTLAAALHDSPVGLAAWLLERRRNWSDCGGDVETVFSKDQLLTNFTLYWATDSFVTSARLYRDSWKQEWRPSHTRQPMVEVPTGVSLLLSDLPPDADMRWLQGYFNLTMLREHAVGGHFAAAERPQAIVEDLRAFFRPMRKRSARMMACGVNT